MKKIYFLSNINENIYYLDACPVIEISSHVSSSSIFLVIKLYNEDAFEMIISFTEWTRLNAEGIKDLREVFKTFLLDIIENENNLRGVQMNTGLISGVFLEKEFREELKNLREKA